MADESTHASYPAADLELNSRQIRLVTILPGRHADEIACELNVVSLDELPRYNSLSYVWGEKTGSYSILLNNVPYRITRNLQAALRRLRSRGKPQVFWIDMICINQSSELEQTHQVNMMQHIYSKAHKVFLWLGDHVESTGQESNSSSHDIFSKKEAVHAFTVIKRMSPRRGSKAFAQPFESIDSVQLGAEFDGLNKLMASSWWQRIWVVQEAILPKNIIVKVGLLHVSWADMFTATRNYLRMFRRCRDRKDYIESFHSFREPITVIETYRSKYHLGTQLCLGELLLEFRLRASTDPRDKVFALLGIVAGASSHYVLQADYKLSANDAYKKTFLHLFRQKGLKFLRGQTEINPTLRLPTWMPDWTAKVDPFKQPMCMAYPELLYMYNASGFTEPMYHWSDAVEVLSIKATFDIDQVIAFADPAPRDGSPFDAKNYLHYVRDFIDNFPNPSPSYIGSWDRDSAFWRFTSMDIAKTIDYRSRSKTHTRATLEIYNAWLNKGIASYTQLHSISDWPGYRPFVTKSGYFGLGPGVMEVGDTIHIFLGGHTPYVLRKANEAAKASGEEAKYEFIGTCYVQGLMDGEALEGVDTDTLGYVHLI
ncbi:heterokaryon incompatibility protein-domain-containing protein [Phaeosphaeriaceae sp. PMI808]|nr:heterokaryon incompatibility protein-domain-containing protein [Phaeosphaeriaceae sp. PMI808]